MSSPHRRTIAAVMGTGMTCFRELLRGINRYGIAKGTWHLDLYSPLDNFVKLVQETKPHGLLLGPINNVSEGRQVLALVPHAVGVCAQHSAFGLGPIVEVECDDERVGHEAAEHFLQKGFTQFAFLGAVEAVWSEKRWRGFRDRVTRAGYTITQRNLKWQASSLGRGWANPHLDADMEQWLHALPKPLALMVCNDLRGRDVAQMSRDCGLRVPEDIAILGVDNDDLDCEMSHPPLSSVSLPWQHLGHLAAELLDRMIDGESIEPRVYPVGPTGVVERQSTDIIAITDPEVRAAIQFIREHSHEPISVEDVLVAVPTARRSLERRFRSLLGRSPLEEIRRVHVERAKRLLTETDLAMPLIAERCGFASAAWFSKAFSDVVGEPPTQYRRRYRQV